MAADLHIHTCYSHGLNTPWEMYLAANNRKLDAMGFSEHSPRPDGYDYTREYRDNLARNFHSYISDVRKLQQRAQEDGGCRVLLGLEMDWLTGELDFIASACKAEDYDYLIGSVHFLDHWGFDDGSEPWRNASAGQCFAWYEKYFSAWHDMLESGLFNIAAHPDLIKIYSVEHFHDWIGRLENQEQVYDCLKTLKNQDMALEVSSAGLRKACGEIYPCREIMELAADLRVHIAIASDAHNMGDVAADFDRLKEYAQFFGFREQTLYNHGQKEFMKL